ncbi:hypothetical protein ACYSUO_18545 [Streptomyces sp. UC4497]
MNRIPLDALTSDQLDTLYERAEQAEAAIERARQVEEEWRTSCMTNGDSAGAHALAMVRSSLDEQPGPAATERCCGKPAGATCVHDVR